MQTEINTYAYLKKKCPCFSDYTKNSDFPVIFFGVQKKSAKL